MFKRILVPIDGSDTGKLGLDTAVRLANEQNAALRAIHVVNEAMILSTYEGDLYTSELIKALRDSGRAILQEAEQHLSRDGVRCETALLEAHGAPAGEVIVEDAKSWQADLIVLGTHGRRGLRRVVMGSDAEHVVRTTPVPVLLVRLQVEA